MFWGILIGFILSFLIKKIYYKLYFSIKTNWRKGLIKKTYKKWGYEKLWAECYCYSSKILFLNKNFELLYNNTNERSFMILSGSVIFELLLNNKRVHLNMSSGEVFHLYPSMKLCIKAVKPCYILEITNKSL